MMEEKISVLVLIGHLARKGAAGLAVVMANRLRNVLGVPHGQVVEGIVKNGDFYQVALRDLAAGVRSWPSARTGAPGSWSGGNGPL